MRMRAWVIRVMLGRLVQEVYAGVVTITGTSVIEEIQLQFPSLPFSLNKFLRASSSTFCLDDGELVIQFTHSACLAY